MVCAHCGKSFSCGCQKTKAKDGKTVHKTCLRAYNENPGVKPLAVSNSSLTNAIKKAKKNIAR